jgi:predicted ABC-type ATPase
MNRAVTQDGPLAVWACGAGASGKSRICESAILPLGFELIDVDNLYEKLLRQYHLGTDIPDSSPEEKEEYRAEFTARCETERAIYKRGPERLFDHRAFLDQLTEKAGERGTNERYLQLLAEKIRTKLGNELVSGETFLEVIFPEMGDWADPMDYLKEQERVTPTKLLMVAKEITQRRIERCSAEQRNLLIVETGTLFGKLIDTKERLEEERYRTFLVWLKLESEMDALRRNEMRRAAGGRGLSNQIIRRTFEMAGLAYEILLQKFAPHTTEIDNTPEGEAQMHARVTEVRRAVSQWMDSR